MNIKPIAAVAAAVFALTLTACGSNEMATSAGSSGSASPSTAPMANQPSTTRMGDFSGLNGKHVAGSVAIDGSNLQFTNFSSDEGPDLHVYLTKGTTESDVAMGKQIGAVRFDQAMQSFSLSGIDSTGYANVVIHCDKAKAVFGAASLK